MFMYTELLTESVDTRRYDCARCIGRQNEKYTAAIDEHKSGL